MKAIPGAQYKHYKNGNEYRVLMIARHSETLEEMVVYEARYESHEYGRNAVWVRPRVMFEENVHYEGALVPRFKNIEKEV